MPKETHEKQPGPERPAPANSDRVTYADKRLMAATSEIRAANKAVRELFEEWSIPSVPPGVQEAGLDLKMRLGAGSGSGTAETARDVLIATVLRAINRARLGEAEGTIAKHKDGRVAKRYYDRFFCCLRWIVLHNEQSDNVTAERLDELGADWTIVHNEAWEITTRFSDDELPI